MTTFDGHVAAMRESQWLASEDLLGLGDVTLTIETVEKHLNVEFEQGRKKPVVYAVKFMGTDKRLVLNATNRKAITTHHGPQVSQWPGKQITIYVQDGILVGKVRKQGLRVRT